MGAKLQLLVVVAAVCVVLVTPVHSQFTSLSSCQNLCPPSSGTCTRNATSNGYSCVCLAQGTYGITCNQWDYSELPGYDGEMLLLSSFYDLTTNTLFMAGYYTGDQAKGVADILLVTMDGLTGTYTGLQLFGTTGTDLGTGVLLAEGYGFIVGYTNGVFQGFTSQGGFDIVVIAFNLLTLEQLAVSQYGTAGDDLATTVAYWSAAQSLILTGSCSTYICVSSFDLTTFSATYLINFFNLAHGQGNAITLDTTFNPAVAFVAGTRDQLVYGRLQFNVGTFVLKFGLQYGSYYYLLASTGTLGAGIVQNPGTSIAFFCGQNGTRGFVTAFNALSQAILWTAAVPNLPQYMEWNNRSTSILTLVTVTSQYDYASVAVVSFDFSLRKVVNTLELAESTYSATFSFQNSSILVAGLSASLSTIVVKVPARVTCPNCNANETCLFLGDGKPIGCACNNGVTGPTCSKDVCDGIVCFNGGSCESHDGGTLCVCAAGFFGEFCADSVLLFGADIANTVTGAAIFLQSIELDVTRNIAYVCGMSEFAFLPNMTHYGFSVDVFFLAINLTNLQPIVAQGYGSAADESGMDMGVDLASNRGYIAVLTQGTLPNNTQGGGIDVGFIVVDLQTAVALLYKQYGGPNDETVGSIAIDPSSNTGFMVGGTTGAFAGTRNVGLEDIFLLAVNLTSGSQIYVRQFGTIGIDVAQSVELDISKGTGYMTGLVSGPLNGNSWLGGTDFFLISFVMSSGNTIYTRQWGGAQNDAGTAMVLSNGYIYITGQSGSVAALTITSPVFKVLMSTGAIVLPTPGYTDTMASTIAADPVTGTINVGGMGSVADSAFSWTLLSGSMNTTFQDTAFDVIFVFDIAMDPLRGLTYSCGSLLSGAGFLAVRRTQECSPDRCTNGGTCITTASIGPYCACPSGFTGSFCEVNINDCSDTSCINGGTCVDGINSYVCVCLESFSGVNCSVDIHPCISSPCSNGGNCSRAMATAFSCLCPPSYTGVLCQSTIDFCASSPCQNDGLCQSFSSNASFTCTCDMPYFGVLCQSTNYCYSSPCLHNGSCTYSATSFACGCSSNYTGSQCESLVVITAGNPDSASSSSGAGVAAGVGVGVGIGLLLLLLLLLLLFVRRRRRQLKALPSSSPSNLDMDMGGMNPVFGRNMDGSSDKTGKPVFNLYGQQDASAFSQPTAAAVPSRLKHSDSLFVDSSQAVRNQEALARLNHIKAPPMSIFAMMIGEQAALNDQALYGNYPQRVGRPGSVTGDTEYRTLSFSRAGSFPAGTPAPPPTQASSAGGSENYTGGGGEEDYLEYDYEKITDDMLVQKLSIDRNTLRSVDKIGQGNFGEVLLMKNLVTKDFVAAKSLHSQTNERDLRGFYAEAKILSMFDHVNVVKLLGICFEKHPALIILEYIPFGDVRNVLRACSVNPNVQIWYAEQCYIGMQIAQGMEYLASIGFVHRDLALRNCLLGYNTTVKIADFGLSRDMSQSKDEYYVPQTRGVAMPIRWMAPESLEFQKFSSKSDVWSFGVVMWEIMTLGTARPYETVENRYLATVLREGKRLQKPRGCPDAMYQMMLRCWVILAKQRPVFTELKQILLNFQNQALEKGERIRALGETLEQEKVDETQQQPPAQNNYKNIYAPDSSI